MSTKPNPEIDAMIDRAVDKTTRKVLQEIGMLDKDAAHDIRTLRGLISTLKIMRRTFWQTIVRWMTIGILALLVAAVSSKLNLFK